MSNECFSGATLVIDLRPLLDHEQMNEPVSPWVRWPLGAILAAGVVFCVGLSVDTIRHWGTLPAPVFGIILFPIIGAVSGVVALKLFRGDRIAGPVDAPPRPIFVRIAGAAGAIVFGMMAATTDAWVQRIELGATALVGLGLVLWSSRFFPQRPPHSLPRRVDP